MENYDRTHFYDTVLKEYDTAKGYDIHEINRCIDDFNDYIHELVGFDDEIIGGLFDDEIDEIVEDCRFMLHETLSGIGCNDNSSNKHEQIDESLARIEKYRGIDQQRTEEWYERRRNMLTASIAQSIINLDLATGKGVGFLREKIIEPVKDKKVIIEHDELHTNTRNTFIPPTNPDAPTIRGIRYEPVIRNVYESLNNVKVEEYDCVPHPVYPFIGASPDGIVTEGATKGRMVEIKCPQPASILKDGNRVRQVYWAQMQLQMEVCDLGSCDYVRAVIREAPTLKEIHKLIHSIRDEYMNCAITKEVGEKDSHIIAAGTIWMDHYGNYHNTDPMKRQFIHENSIYKNTELEVMFIRHYVIFSKDWFTVTIQRNRDWFSNIFLPKAITAWEEIQRGRKDPNEWLLKYPVKRRNNVIKKESALTEVYKDPTTCILLDD